MLKFKHQSKMKIDNINVTFNKLHQEASLTVTYIEENDEMIVRHTINAPLGLASYPNIAIHGYEKAYDLGSISVDFGFGPLEYATMESRVLKTKTKKMTIAEIEKALGHKVEIVGEE